MIRVLSPLALDSGRVCIFLDTISHPKHSRPQGGAQIMEVDILSLRLEEALVKLQKITLFNLRGCIFAAEDVIETKTLTKDPEKISEVEMRLKRKKDLLFKTLDAERLLEKAIRALAAGDLSARSQITNVMSDLESLFLGVPECFT